VGFQPPATRGPGVKRCSAKTENATIKTALQEPSKDDSSDFGDRIPNGSPDFRTTHWSDVIEGGQGDEAVSRKAVGRLYVSYFYPLYVFVRRKGYSSDDAKDLTQGFFAKLLEKNYLQQVDAEKGRFRSFLLAAMEHFRANEWNRNHRQKRGGEACVLPLDIDATETRYLAEPADSVTPEVAFDRRWAMTVIQRVLARLRAEYVEAGKSALFEELKDFLSEKQPAPHEEVAKRHDISAGNVGVAIHRLRKRYKFFLRDEITQTLGRNENVDDEIRYLIQIIGRGT
jgi:RNA polymerase sigma-70 factor (ECF subfamily)